MEHVNILTCDMKIKKSLKKRNSDQGIETVKIFENKPVSAKKKKLTVICRKKHRDGSVSVISREKLPVGISDSQVLDGLDDDVKMAVSSKSQRVTKVKLRKRCSTQVSEFNDYDF